MNERGWLVLLIALVALKFVVLRRVGLTPSRVLSAVTEHDFLQGG